MYHVPLSGRKQVRVMRDEWGRVKTQSWPGDKPVWTYGVLMLSLTVACAGLWLRCQTWTPLQQYWLMTYLSANIMPGFNVSTSKYGLMVGGGEATIRYAVNWWWGLYLPPPHPAKYLESTA